MNAPDIRPKHTTEEIYQLIYISAARAVFSEQAIYDLVKGARTRNRARGITGLLLHHDGNFLQLLEGPEELVKTVFDAISRDPRHTEVLVLYQGTSPARLCDGWSMGYGKPPQDSLQEEMMFQITREGLDTRLSDKGSELARALIRSFLNLL